MANSIDTNKIAANSITAGLIAAGAITASHVGTNTIIANSANIANSVITNAHIVDLTAGKLTAGTITAAVTMSAAYINGGKIDGGGLTVYSAVGIRANDDASVLTITGGSDNGSSHGSSIDLCGNSAGTGLNGVMVLQAGQGTDSAINLLTNQSPATNVGVLRASIDTYGVFRVERNLSNGSVYTTGAGNAEIEYALGVGTTASTTNQGQIDASGAVNASSFNSTSALKYKENIRDLTDALDIIDKLNPVVFDWKDGRRKNDAGFIADHVAPIIPNIVQRGDDGEINSMSYDKLTPYLLAAIKEQQMIIDNLSQRISRLEKM